MFHYRKQTLIALAGSIWFLIGVGLLTKGLHLLIFTPQIGGAKVGPLLNAFMYVFTGALVPGMIFLIVLGLLLGWIKGRLALGRSARRTIERVTSLKGNVRITKLYRLHDYLLVAAMVGLGRLMHWMEFPADIHGVIDVTIGSALVNGAMIYFRFALKLKEQEAH